MKNFSPTPALPQSNIEVEIGLLSSILVDSSAIYQVAEILPVEAFYSDAHKDIYQAALSLYKHQKEVNLLTVTSWLADHDLLLKVGGRNQLASLVNSFDGSDHITGYADVLIEKHIRRQLSTLANEIDLKAHEQHNPLAWTLEDIEQRLLSITQLRNAKGKGYWQKVDCVDFEQVCKELEEIEDIENAAQRDWLMRKLSKKWKFANKKELLDFHAKWLDSKNTAKTYNPQEYFQKYGLTDQDWLIPGFIPASSVIVLYADGGVGKTRLAFTLAKHAVTGGTFAYEGTDFPAMNTLLVETDQGPRNTSKLLEMQDFLEDNIVGRLSICDEWSAGEFGKLKSMIKQHESKLIIIDSLTSISVNSLYSENDTEYARPLVRLRHIAKEYGCSFLVIHHSNAGGEMRGSRAIRNTVDEVWKFSKRQNEIGEFNVLTIDKTRSRGPGSYKFTYDDETWGWKFGGRLEDDVMGNALNSANVMNQCIRFLRANKGVVFEALEVSEALGISKDTVRKDLRRAASEGLVNTGRSVKNRKAVVYYVGSRLLSNITSDPSDPSDPQVRITSKPLVDIGFQPSDPSDPPNLLFSIVTNEKNADHLDHLDHLDLKPLPDKEKEVIHRPDHLDHLDHIDEGCVCGSYTVPLDKENTPESQPGDCVKTEATSSELPLIEEKGVYWSKTYKKEVKVFQIFDSLGEVSCIIPGRGTCSVPFKDLACCPKSPRSNLIVLDQVVILSGKHKEKFATITSINVDGIYLRTEQGKSIPKMYLPHQVVKV
jgi:replicative DNA helicase